MQLRYNLVGQQMAHHNKLVAIIFVADDEKVTFTGLYQSNGTDIFPSDFILPEEERAVNAEVSGSKFVVIEIGACDD